MKATERLSQLKSAGTSVTIHGRPVTRATLGSRPEAAWETTPTSVLIGDRDNLLPEVDRKWARDHLDDIRMINTDHFIIFRHPEVVAQLVLEALGRK
jgi:pimeloyl-ACP methyl ester carboxylesterase